MRPLLVNMTLNKLLLVGGGHKSNISTGGWMDGWMGAICEWR